MFYLYPVHSSRIPVTCTPPLHVRLASEIRKDPTSLYENDLVGAFLHASFIVASLFSSLNTEQAGENHVILCHTTQMNDV
jgi:hypothetical protein